MGLFDNFSWGSNPAAPVEIISTPMPTGTPQDKAFDQQQIQNRATWESNIKQEADKWTSQVDQDMPRLQQSLEETKQFLKNLEDPNWVPPNYSSTSATLQPTSSNTLSQSYTPGSSTSSGGGRSPTISGGGQWGTGINNGPMVNGTMQTGGGGFTPDGSYSAGYHGGGLPGPDMGPWGTGQNMGPMVNGTVQTGGGGFTPDGTYSTGYHGSGEHPEITGESLPGVYASGSFGSVHKPDFSNGVKINDWINYVKQMGYDTSKLDVATLARQYDQTGGNLDGIAILRTLPNADANKTELLSQATSNPMMPTSQALALLGGINYSSLGKGLPTTPGTTAYAPGMDMYGTGKPYAWTPGNAFGRGGYGSQGNNPTGPYAGWSGADVPVNTPRIGVLSQSDASSNTAQTPVLSTAQSTTPTFGVSNLDDLIKKYRSMLYI